MGNTISSFVALTLSFTAAVFALIAWRKSSGLAKKYLGWGGLILLTPAILLVICLILSLLAGAGLIFIRFALGLSAITLIIGAAFVVYGALALQTKENKTEAEKTVVRDALIAAGISGIGAATVLFGFFSKAAKTNKSKSPSSLGKLSTPLPLLKL